MKQLGSLLVIGVFIFVCLLPPKGQATVNAPQNPSSAKECALCHYRWIDTFFVAGKSSELVPYQADKVVAKAEMCFSCHDGSVADSRIRVFNDKHHAINKPPPANMVIPDIFPLDENGNMQCATCHTAHGVPSEMGMDKTIFVRTSNDDSGMCRQCHVDKTGGPSMGNHPLDVTSINFSSKLLRLGAVEGGEKNQIICESCHRVHGAPNDKFLVDSPWDEGHLCLDCHTDKKGLINTVHDLRISAPDSTNIKGKKPEESGICGTCHVVHGKQKIKLWARKLPTSSSGNRNIDLCLSCHDPGQIGEKKVLTGFSHPYDVSLQNKHITPNLPFFSVEGNRVPSTSGRVTCATCHDAHKANNPTREGEPGKGDKFLRYSNKPSPNLCRQCHPTESLVELTDHDLLAGGFSSVNKLGQRPTESGTCGVCHLIHHAENVQLWALGNAENSKHKAEKICLFCHAEEETASTKVLGKRSHPVNLHPSALGITTTLPLFDPLGEKDHSGAITCLTCHNPHRWSPENDSTQSSIGHEGDGTNSFLRLPSAPNAELCSDCHKKQALISQTDHDMNIVAPESNNLLGQTPAESGACGACHLVHNGRTSVRLWARKLRRGNGILDKMCKSCHNKKDIGAGKVPKADSHPDGMLITNVGRDNPEKANYFPLFHKMSGAKVRVSDISCASCHDVHRWDPRMEKAGSGKNIEGKTTDSFLRMQTYSIMCIDCHGLDALFRFKYYHNSKQRGPNVE